MSTTRTASASVDPERSSAPPDQSLRDEQPSAASELPTAVYTEGGLRAGWEPDTPLGDTLLRRFLVNWTEAVTVPVQGMGGRCLERDDLAAADLGRPSALLNVTTLLRPLDLPHLDQVMATLDAFYATPAAGEVLLFSPWPVPDLRPYGWTLAGHPPLMLRAAGGPPPPLPHDLVIEQVHDEAGLAAFTELVVRGFPLPGISPSDEPIYDGEVLTDPRRPLWLGRVEGRAVSAAAAFVAAGINHVTLVATLPEARRRGFGQALTWKATLADPALPALLLASDDGRPVYARMGYLPLLRFTCWIRSRPEETEAR